MRKKIVVTNQAEEQQQPKNVKRLNIIFILVFLIFSAMVLRLAHIQIADGQNYVKLASKQNYKETPITAIRGNIYDKNGKMIVNNRASFTAVFHELEDMTGNDYLNLATKLEKALAGTTKASLLKKMDVGYELKNGKMERTMRLSPKLTEKDLKYDLSQKEIAYLEEHLSDLPGVSVITKPIRVYDPKEVAVQAIGYVRPYHVAENLGSDFYLQQKDHYLPNQMVGLDGVERSYEEQLRGENGYQKYEVTSDQTIIKMVEEKAPTKGNDLYLTIDEDVQLEIRDFIKNFMPSLRQKVDKASHAKGAYVVAMEVKTGKIVAMVSYPEYDPNVWSKGLDSDTYDQIKYSVTNGTIKEAPYDVRPKTGKEAEAENYKHPQSIVPAGSVVKPITVLMGMAENVISPYDSWNDPGAYHYGRGTDTINNDQHHNYGVLTPQKALQKSSNTYMARIGELMSSKYGKEAVNIMQNYYHAFGLGVQTGIDLPGENKGKEDYLVMNKDYGPLAAMVQSSFGQQVRLTTIQLAQYAATLANKGVRIQPQIVEQIKDSKGNVVQAYTPKVMNTIDLPDLYWNIVHNGMYLVTQPGGTAINAFAGFPYKIAAKTGTSEQDIYTPTTYVDKMTGKTKEKWSRYARITNGVLISFAPLENPKLAVAVVVPEGGYGGRSAANIARAVYDIYDQHVGLGTPVITNK
ncbi:peptidoglycan D,D-transpeptidase FtsI family protein [Brevibacillus sp. SIMBA_040]|uniref:peptidoglycan D,D-transpeptidase FtsI family protein n=1 Tax=unclassified Brevibacillus TaxID=2684853 RepID=UPI00397B36FA